jgi:threonine dehydrogenase-like Zn-dependent dehydrogenase
MFGGYAGGQAEYVRVPFADFCAFPVPDHLTDEQVLFLTDIFPTGYQAAENGNIKPGDVVAVWGAGPVGQFVIKSAFMLGAEKVIAVDSITERLQLASEASGAIALNYSGTDVVEELKELTGGRGPDVCIDAVGFESQGHSPGAIFDKVAFLLKLETDKVHVQRQAIQACRKGGTISTPGVYLDVADFYPIGVAFGKGLQMRMGQTNMHKYILPLMDKIQKGEIDPSFVITHRMPLSEAAKGYEIFKYRKDGCIKVVLKP